MSNENLRFEKLNYNSYLKIPELLDLQKQLSDPPHHDEMFFIIIHQATELWFKEMMHDTELLVKSLRDNSISRALKALRRNVGIMDLLCKQINLLSTLTPVEFAGFRDMLRPASGFQSLQFRQMEFTYGLREQFFLKFFKSEPEYVQKLEGILKQPSVYDEVLKCLHANGYKVPEALLKRDVSEQWQHSDELAELFKEIYESPKENYHWVLFFESLLDFDEKIALWRQTHILMVARTIGAQEGTGGSSGIEFLQKRATARFFPELWTMRTLCGGKY